MKLLPAVLLSLLTLCGTSAADDAVPPSLAIDSPAPGETLTAPLAIAGTAADDTAVERVELMVRNRDTGLFWNGAEFQSAYTRVGAALDGAPEAPAWSLDFDPELDGRYQVSARTWDTAGNLGPFADVRFTLSSVAPDDTPPSLAIDSPAPGETLTAPLAIAGTAADDTAVERVELMVRNRDTGLFWNGAEFQSAYTRVGAALDGAPEAPAWSLDFDPELDGRYQVSARTWDTAGNLGPFADVRFTLSSVAPDDTPPSLAIDSPASGETLTAPLAIAGTAADDTAVERVELMVRNRDTGLFWNGAEFQSAYTRVGAALDGAPEAPAWSLDFDPELDGRYQVSARTWDTAGNLGPFADVRFTLSSVASGEAPVVSIAVPAAGATLDSLGTVTGTAIDDSGVERVELVLQDLDTEHYWSGALYYPAFAAPHTTLRTTLSGPPEAREWQYDFDFAIDGNYRLTVLARDGDGNATEPAPTIDFSIASVAQSGNEPDLSGYEMVFRDEFGGSALDSTKWRTSYYWGPYLPINNERQLYVDTLGINRDFEHDPFEFTGSTLRINATPVGGPVQPPQQPPANDPVWTSGRNGYRADFSHKPDYDPSRVEYLSGVITSIEKFDATHGYFEARMKIPAGRGLWPAFWLLNKKYVEDVPEIDIMENLGQRPDLMQHMYHYFEPRNNWRKISTPEAPSSNADLSSGFHTYAVAWEPGQIVWYIDGIERRRVTSDRYDISGQAMYLLANLAVGGWAGAPDDPDIFPATLEIDYIRAWRKRAPAAITPAVLRDDFQIVFEDEFGAGSPSKAKWNTSYPWGPFLPIAGEDGVYEEQYYVDSLGIDGGMTQQPFSNEGGVLSITAEALDPNELRPHPPINDPIWLDYRTYQRSAVYEDGDWTPGYTSGVITTREAFTFVHGYAEIRARLPEGQGLWPSLRLLPGYYVGPKPTIDIATLRGEEPGTLHRSHVHTVGITPIANRGQTTAPGGQSYADGFHDYGIEWRPGVVKWYVDGELVGTLEDENVSTQLMYLSAGLGVGGDFVDAPEPTVFPASVQIDHVRVWQRKDIH